MVSSRVPQDPPAAGVREPERLPVRVALGIGANLGDRFQNLVGAVRALLASGCVHDLVCSPVAETVPLRQAQDGPGADGPGQGAPDADGMGTSDQPLFLNAVVIGMTALEPAPLLAQLKAIERALGRRPGEARWGPRVIDIDLLDHGEQRRVEPGLELPHPGLAERAFVLEPWALVDPGAHPGGGSWTVSALCARWRERGAGEGGVLRWLPDRLPQSAEEARR